MKINALAVLDFQALLHTSDTCSTQIIIGICYIFFDRAYNEIHIQSSNQLFYHDAGSSEVQERGETKDNEDPPKIFLGNDGYVFLYMLFSLISSSDVQCIPMLLQFSYSHGLCGIFDHSLLFNVQNNNTLQSCIYFLLHNE